MSDSKVQVIPLPAQFVQTQLSSLRDLVDGHQKDGCLVQFDANQVKRIDGAAVQFLLASVRLLKPDTQNPLVLNANDVVVNALSDMGLDSTIGVSVSQSPDAA